MLDDADFARLTKIIDMAIDTRVRGVIAEEVRKVVDERVREIIAEEVRKVVDERVAAIVDARMQYFEARFDRRLSAFEKRFDAADKRMDSIDKRIDIIDKRVASLEEQIKELRGFAIQTRDKQRETYALVTQIWDNLKGLYSRDMDQDARLDIVEQIIRRWGTPPAQPQS